MKQLSPNVLDKLTHTKFPESYAVLATTFDGRQEQQIGVVRFAQAEDDDVAEFAVVVADEWQGLGVASLLLRGVIAAATVAGIRRLDGLVLRENHQMLTLARNLGFGVSRRSNDDPTVVRVSKDLRSQVHQTNPSQQTN